MRLFRRIRFLKGMVPLLTSFCRQLRTLLPAAGLCVFVALLSLRSSEAADLARSAITLCCRSVAPSLFPFFVACSLVTSLGYAQTLGQITAPLMGHLFGVGGAGAAAFVLGLLGGYPSGTRTVCELCRSGACSKQEGERLLLFCNNCGPAFLLGAAGGGVFGSTACGFLLWGSHIAGAVTVGLLCRLFLGKTDGKDDTAIQQPPAPSFAKAFPRAVESALHATLLVSAYVVFFSVLAGLLQLPGLVLPGLVEMSGGVLGLKDAALPLREKLAIAGGLMGFGGLSVHLQSAAFWGEAGLSGRRCFFAKLLHGLLAAGYSWLSAGLLPS